MKKHLNGKEITKQEFIDQSIDQLKRKATTPKKIGTFLKLNSQEIKFVEIYASPDDFFANGINAAKIAFEFEEDSMAEKKANYLLKQNNITTFINILLNLEGLNDEFADKQLLFLMTQNSHLPSKLQAIKEYNVLKQRINNSMELKITPNWNFDNFTPQELETFIQLAEKGKTQ